jgi:peptide/nickel transport system substrate-binding protein
MKRFFKNFFINLKSQEKGLVHDVKEHFGWEKELIKKVGKNEGHKIPHFHQLKYLPSILTKKERKRFIIFSLILIVALVFLFSRLYSKLPLVPTFGGEYTEGLIGEVNAINPIFDLQNETEQDLVKIIFSGLVTWTDGELVPDLAEKWEIKENGKQYIFYLRKDVWWHDLQPFNADDVIFNIESVQNAKVQSPLKEAFSHLKVKKIDDYKIEFDLEKSFSPFLSYLTFGLLPKHLWQNVEPEKFYTDAQNLSPVGTGPFKFISFDYSETDQVRKIVLERNEKYYLHPPYLKNITFRLFNSYDEASDALLTKKIEGLAHYRKTDEIETVPKVFNSYKSQLSYLAVTFFDEMGILGNKKIREALTYAIDKNEINSQLENITLANAIISNPYYSAEKTIKKYEYNKEEAENLLKEAGYKKNKDGWFADKKGNELKIAFVVSDKLANQKIGDILKNFWEAIGVKINLKILSSVDFQKVLLSHSYDIILNTVIEGYDPDPYPLWHSSQITRGLNFSSFRDIQTDSILEKARLSNDRLERKKYYEDFQKIIAENLPAVVLYQTTLSYFRDKKIKGFIPDYLPTPSDRFSQIEDWHIYFKRTLFKK